MMPHGYGPKRCDLLKAQPRKINRGIAATGLPASSARRTNNHRTDTQVMINGRVAPLADGSIGFDVTTRLNPASAKQYYNKNFRFVGRYIGRGDGSSNYVDLSQEEGQIIVDAGLGLGVVQHPLAEGWHPTHDLGARFGSAA